MQLRFSVILSGAVLLMGIYARPSLAEEKIRAFVNSSGGVLFTNNWDNNNTPPPPPPVLSETTGLLAAPDILADQVPPYLRTLIDTTAINYGVDPALVRAVMKTESNFNRWAVSNKGARGLMQLIPSTGVRFGVRDFFDPQQNIEGGVRYLRFLLEKFNGNLDLSLAAYNAGENLVERLGRIPPIVETTNYVHRIRAIYKKPSAPVLAAAPAAAIPTLVASAQTPAKPEPQKIFRLVDEAGVVHFSNIEPPK
jgi:soluble lytic murein transglycosylase-like protein